MPRPREYDDELRGKLLEAASRLLTAEGPHALSTRRIAADVGTSTSAIYTLIGSKEELVRQMCLEGFRRLADHLGAVPANDDPLVHLAGLGQAYLDNALENPSLYRVMFSRIVPEYVPCDEDSELMLSTLQTLIDAIQRCVDAGLLHGDAEDLAVGFWAAEHGVISLAVVDMLDEERARRLYEHTMTALLLGMTKMPAIETRPSKPKGKPSAATAIQADRRVPADVTHP